MTPDNNWRAGDLAVCIAPNCDAWQGIRSGTVMKGPQAEQVLLVKHVEHDCDYEGVVEPGLEFHEFPWCLYPASLFRKIHPDAQPADDAEIIALIKGRQPATASSFQFPVAVSPASDRAARWVASPIPNLAIHRAALALEGN